MPELPEVQTTVNGLRRHVVGLHITDVWSDYNSPYFKGSDTIKDSEYFSNLKKEIVGMQIVSVDRRAKNILISVKSPKKVQKAKTAKTILIHLKMTGHLLYGLYLFNDHKKIDPWEALEPEALKDRFNKHVHFVITFSNKKHLALSDVRKFAKVTLIDSEYLHASSHLNTIGPEPLDKSFTFEKFTMRIGLKSNGKIKQVLMDQSVIAGIGNIYADESLWLAGINPARKVSSLASKDMKLLYNAIKHTLTRGIRFGGDSTSDYRNIHGNKGKFHENHHAYQRTGSNCDKDGCKGHIIRIMLAGRSTHFCDTHQRFKNKT